MTKASLFCAISTFSLVYVQASFAQGARLEGPRIEVRHARSTPAPGFVYTEFAYPALMDPSQLKTGLYVEKRGILSDEDFKSVRASPTPSGLTLVVQLTPQGASRMFVETKGRIGSHLATFLDSRLVSAARLASPVGADPDVPIFMGLRVPEGVAEETTARVAARWPTPH